ncbi:MULTISPECIES: hypothetical protein [unclassified Ensifer]|uniref:hypothetical protein n=1 Tax=unclassified Ensifer TaxID=2633371 RepID=UPI000B0B3960|nr:MULTISPECIES: hypothetical protein [unclassified Ensifer]
MTPDRSAQPPSQPIADLQIAIAAFVAGARWLFSIQAFAEFPPLLFLGSRFLIAGLRSVSWRGLHPLPKSAGRCDCCFPRARLCGRPIALVKRNSTEVRAVAAAAIQLVVAGVIILAVSLPVEQILRQSSRSKSGAGFWHAS